MLRFLVNLTIFSIAFLSVAAGVREYAPSRLKVEWFEQRADDYEMVLLGSSHVFRQLDSEFIGAQLSNSQTPFDVFNFGVPGMRFAEIMYMANRILELDSPDLKFLVLELGDLRSDIEDENLFTERLVYWHDFFATSWVIKSLWQEDVTLTHKLDLGVDHLHHFAHWLGNIGRGPDVWAKLKGGARESFFTDAGELRPGLGVNGHGWRPLDLEANKKSYQKRRRDFLADLDGFRKSKKNLAGLKWTGQANPTLAQAIDDLERRAADKGVELIFMTLASFEKPKGWLDLQQSGHIKRWVKFNDPNKYPELYRAKNRWDYFHLNQQGSAKLRESFASQLKPMIEERL